MGSSITITCGVCKQKEIKPIVEQYHFVESGLDNVYLLNCRIMKCGCGPKGVLLPFDMRAIFEPIVFELIQHKFSILSPKEFVCIRRHLFVLAQVSDEFAKSIGFQNRDLLKINDWTKLVGLKTLEDVQKCLQENFCSGDDVIINEQCSKEIRNCIAHKLGLSGEAELLQIGKEKPLTDELDRKLRELAKSAIGEVPMGYGHASRLDNHTGEQTIYIDMAEDY